MSSLVLTISSEETQSYLQQILQLDANKDKEIALACGRYLSGMAHRNFPGSLKVQTGSASPVAASGTFTLASVIATDVAIIGGVSFTFTSTPSAETDVEVDGADDTADALALANAINAHSTISQIVEASSALGVVTITCKQKGVVGNFIAISSPDATITASGALLSGGTGGVDDAGIEVSF